MNRGNREASSRMIVLFLRLDVKFWVLTRLKERFISLFLYNFYMNIELWKPLKIISPLLKDIFNKGIDSKYKVHPLVIFENKKDNTYYCIRLQTATNITIKHNVSIDNKTYQDDGYWNDHQGVAVTKDIFIIDKELLEKNIDWDVYNKTNSLNDKDRELIVDDLEKRINSAPPELNIIKILDDLKDNITIYTNKKMINSQVLAIVNTNSKKISEKTKNYYKYHFDKDKFLSYINTSNIKDTQEALKSIKLCVNKEKGLKCKDNFEYKLNKETDEYYLAKKRILKP
ncbi:Mbov_0400 family ICE element protein [Mycoplasmopsis primatum]|uniref:Mbov_0400 family ICE element protein n=1 Tax=Mycoplasmopsis primatum TaxID=55604 RepID=UPI0012EC8173|nr:hypothetical protein [Mycoplasmopsis primatum]